MNTEGSKIPDIEKEPVKKISLNQLTTQLEQEITENLFRPFNSEYKASLDFLHTVEYGLEVGKATGELS